jgi:two-component system osmolarity sensor histidine kinase EnvZ
VRWAPTSLFARTALLIAGTIALFSIVAWQAIVWTAIDPAAELAVPILTQRAIAAVAARRAGVVPPEGTRFETVAPAVMEPRLRGFAFRAYVDTIRSKLQAGLKATEVRVHRIAGPSEIWVRTREVPDAWLVLTWRVADPKAPLAALGVLALAAVLVLGGAALFARRMTAPLAALATAAGRLAEGEPPSDIVTVSGPREVRALALAFQSMSQRLTELDQQRELMLGGISHDLRTPLARLRVVAELLETGDENLTAEMKANIEEMDRMVGQFLHYVRAGYREPVSPSVLDDIVRETLALDACDERLRLELAAAERRGFAANGVRQTLLNLVQNALEHGRAPVTVRTSLFPTELQIEVEDRGDGLSEEEWSVARRPFHRLRPQPAGGHTGLGLALVERLVLVCGGRLDARRVADGFVVTVRLPAVPVPQPA